MNRIVIIGGGFGGLACARALRGDPDLTVTLLDRKTTFDFLPLLPDILGGRSSPHAVRVPLADCATRHGFRFVQDEAVRVDMAQRLVYGLAGTHDYDFLVIAAGARTNFYGNDSLADAACKLDDADDAERLCAAVDRSQAGTFVVAGGGYTGVEIATNLRRRLTRAKQNKRIVVVESAGEIMSALPEWMRRYVERNLARLNVEVLVNCRVQTASRNRILLSNGSAFEPALLVWSAGVRTPAFVHDLGLDQTPQGRLKTDEFLQASDRVFAIGDTAGATPSGPPLRMAVQYALAQGALTGANLRRRLHGAAMRPYRPRDLGYVMPMANLRACGVVLGMNARGLLPSLLHYALCLYHSRGIGQRLRVLRNLFGIFR